jgi:REP element-mobilizing transposase RayT
VGIQFVHGRETQTLPAAALPAFYYLQWLSAKETLDSAAAREIFEDDLERRWYGCYISGYVVMPEHVHLLISEPERSELSVVIQMLTL